MGNGRFFSMVCSKSELRLVELFTFPGYTKSLRKVKLGQLAWGFSPQKYLLPRNISHSKTALVLARIEF